MPSDSQPGPRPAWNGWGLGMAALGIATFVILFAPAAPVADAPVDTTVPAPGPTITLDDLEAMLAGDPGDPPPSVEVQTPEGPVTVVLPPVTTAAPVTTSTTTTSPPPTTTTQPERPLVTPQDWADRIGAALDTIPEGAGGEP